MPQSRPPLPPLAMPVAPPVAMPVAAPPREPPAGLYAVTMIGCAVAGAEMLGCFLLLIADATPRTLAVAIGVGACLGFIMLTTLGFGLFYRHLHARAGAPRHTSGRATATLVVPVVNLVVAIALGAWATNRSGQTTDADARAARWARNMPTAPPAYVSAPQKYGRVTLTFLNSTGRQLDAVTVTAPDGLRIPLGPLAIGGNVSKQVDLAGHASLDAVYTIGDVSWTGNLYSRIVDGQASFPMNGTDIRLPPHVAATLAGAKRLAATAAPDAPATPAIAKRPAAAPPGPVAARPAVSPLKASVVMRRHNEPQYTTTVLTLAANGELTWELTEFVSDRPKVQSHFTPRVTRRRGEAPPEEVAAVAQTLRDWPQWSQVPTGGREVNYAVLEVRYGDSVLSDLQIRTPRAIRDLYDRLEQRGRGLPPTE